MSHPNEAVAAAIHRAADLLIERDMSEQSRREVLALMEQVNSLLETGRAYSEDERFATFLRQMVPELGAKPVIDGDAFAGFDESPYSGTANALRPTEVSYTRDGDAVSAVVVMGSALEGRPARAHGGATAAVFDDVMGAMQRVIGVSGYTRTLTVDYLAPLPADEPVTFRAWQTGTEGRRFTIDATATHDGKVVASATGVFTAVSFQGTGRSQT